MNKKIGLLLGSFDPPHIGHVWAANYALNQGLDEVWVIPAWQNPWKSNQTDFNHRVNMCLLTFDNDEETIRTIDIDGTYKSHYTYEGLEKLLETTSHFNRQYYIIGGTDIAEQVPNWKHGDWVLKNFGLIKVPRAGYEDCEVGIECSSTYIRNIISENKNPTPFINNQTYNYIKYNKIY